MHTHCIIEVGSKTVLSLGGEIGKEAVILTCAFNKIQNISGIFLVWCSKVVVGEIENSPNQNIV